MKIYASPTNSIGAGTASNPTTLQDACSKAVAGDIIQLLPGTYRGTYKPASGVTLEGSGLATISGLDVVTGFVKVGSFYTASVAPLSPVPNSMGADQVFIDGVEVLESRWPAATTSTRGDISSWAEATAVSTVTVGSNYETTYSAPNIPVGDLTDCYGHVLNGHQWITVGGQVIASSPGTVTIRFPSEGKEYSDPTVGSYFYIWGGAALPHGFHMAGGKLHLGTNPGTSKVEVKARHWGIDVRGKVGVTVKGVTLQSCSIQTDALTAGLVLDTMNIYNLTHFQAPSTYWNGPWAHIELRNGGKVINSKVKHCAGGFASLRGTGCLVDNVTVMDVSYTGCCQPGVDLQGSNHTVSRSTLGMAGAQTLLDMRQVTDCTFRGCEVYGGGGLLTDGGSVMFADSGVTADQGNKVLECVIHDTRGRTGPQPHLYGNAGLYLEGGASAHIKDCHIWGATSIDLQAVPLTTPPGYVVVEYSTLGSLNLSYSGTATSIPITYKHNIVGLIHGGDALKVATVVDNMVDTQAIEGNTQASNVLSTLDRGYPTHYTPPNYGARSGLLYYYGAYDRSLAYVPTATRDPLTGVVRIKLDGPPPPDGFTVAHSSLMGIVRQYLKPVPHLVVTFPPTVNGVAELVLSAPGSIPKALSVPIPGQLLVTKSSGSIIQGVGFTPNTHTKIKVVITSTEESWDVPIPVPVADYITQGLMGADGTGLAIKEGLAFYVDPTYPVGGTHAWVRVPHIPLGASTFTLLLGGTNNLSSAEDTFLVEALHLEGEKCYNKELAEGFTVDTSGGDLVIAGTTTVATKYGNPGIKIKDSYRYSKEYPNRPFSWDSYISVAPNTASYWWAGLGNNSFLLTNAGTVVSGSTNKASTLGGSFSHKLVSNIQLQTSMVWQEGLKVINTREGLPNAVGVFNLMVGEEGKSIEFRYHYIRARGVPSSGVLPTIILTPQPSLTRLWVDGVEYTGLIVGSGYSTITLSKGIALAPGDYDVRVALDNGEDYLLPGGYHVPEEEEETTAPPSTIPTPIVVPVPTPTPVTNPPTIRAVGFGPLASRPPIPNPGQVYISYEGVCYAYLDGVWAPYQVVEVGSTKEALPITGTWPQGTMLVKVGSVPSPSGTLPLSGQELPLSSYGSLYTSLGSTLGTPLPKTNGDGMGGITHFLLPNYKQGVVAVPSSIVIGFGGWPVHQPGKDYTIEWLVVV